ncbi:MAG: hypothetical protein NTX88_04395 [Candidatus Atribacteria bacterium]|nr:hypothetical protein [Candidatus Atribacteria bacterium]
MFLELLQCFVRKGWVNQIDEQSLTRIDKSYILSDFREKEADLVYQVNVKIKLNNLITWCQAPSSFPASLLYAIIL